MGVLKISNIRVRVRVRFRVKVRVRVRFRVRFRVRVRVRVRVTVTVSKNNIWRHLLNNILLSFASGHGATAPTTLHLQVLFWTRYYSRVHPLKFLLLRVPRGGAVPSI